MTSHTSSDSGMQHVIQELESLQLSEAAKGYFMGVSQSELTMSVKADFE